MHMPYYRSVGLVRELRMFIKTKQRLIMIYFDLHTVGNCTEKLPQKKTVLIMIIIIATDLQLLIKYEIVFICGLSLAKPYKSTIIIINLPKQS